jgi:hypothetical protein
MTQTTQIQSICIAIINILQGKQEDIHEIRFSVSYISQNPPSTNRMYR